MEELKDFIYDLIRFDYGGAFDRIEEPSLDDLMMMRELVNTAIAEKVYETHHPDGDS